MSLVSDKPVAFAIGTYTDVPAREPDSREREAPEDKPVTPPASNAVTTWAPPQQPGTWQRVGFRLFGQPEPGLDGRFDHLTVDASLVGVPKDPALARVVLALGRKGELSVKRLYDMLASDRAAASVKPKALCALRKELRLAAEKLDARSPGDKIVDNARRRLDALKRELDALDMLRTQPEFLAERAEGGAAALLAAADGHHADVTALIAGARNAVGTDHAALAVVQASLAGMGERRNALSTSLDAQLVDLRSARLERAAAAASAAAAARVAEHDAAVAERARVDAIVSLSPNERARLVERMQRFERLGGRFFAATGGNAHVRPHDVLPHLALSGIDYALGPTPSLKASLGEALGLSTWQGGERTNLRTLAALEDVLTRADLRIRSA